MWFSKGEAATTSYRWGKKREKKARRRGTELEGGKEGWVQTPKTRNQGGGEPDGRMTGGKKRGAGKNTSKTGTKGGSGGRPKRVHGGVINKKKKKKKKKKGKKVWVAFCKRGRRGGKKGDLSCSTIKGGGCPSSSI